MTLFLAVVLPAGFIPFLSRGESHFARPTEIQRCFLLWRSGAVLFHFAAHEKSAAELSSFWRM